MAMMGFMQEVGQEADRQQRAAIFNAQLKNQMLNASGGAAGEVRDLAGKTFDVFDMTMSGIQVAQAIHDALALTQAMRLVEDVGKDAQAISTAIRGADRFMYALEPLGPLATYVSFWIELAGAWAEAKGRILKDNAARGMSVGVVLGANDETPPYVASNFWQQTKARYPAYREVELAARNLHNAGLVAGYAQGKALSLTQRKRFIHCLHGKMTEGDRSYYFDVDSKDWGSRMRKGYYLVCAALFRKDHLN
jgi:hypothetical protein